MYLEYGLFLILIVCCALYARPPNLERSGVGILSVAGIGRGMIILDDACHGRQPLTSPADNAWAERYAGLARARLLLPRMIAPVIKVRSWFNS